MINMLRVEASVRLSDAIQLALDSSISGANRMNAVVEQIQLAVIGEFGFTKANGNVEQGLNLIRSAQSLFPNDPDVREASFYIKHNRAQQGVLSVGDDMADAKLLSLDGKPLTLSKYIAALPDKPVVLLAGSAT